jgi:glycosyltransferase involved in cell wall biosynthesis
LIKVSVIVPVYNPGANIDQCISSLLGQSLPDDEYELVFVDDGSTDSTPGRLDRLADEHRNVSVEHIPNSGWPGRPRNVGIEMARGEFVYFVDNDDWLERRALERLHNTALENDADIVIGKVVGHGKTVPRSLFRRSRVEVSLDWPPLLRLLTPHKLFRRALLDEHGIRFPEGRRRLEDHMFVVHAYFHAKRISVLANYACYHWVFRGDTNASFQQFDPVGYFANVREVLDLVDEHTQPGPLRDQLYAHWYRSKMLARVGGSSFIGREPEYRRRLYDEIHRLAVERYGPEVDEHLPFHLRVRSRLLREGSYESLQELATFDAELRADVRVREMRWSDSRIELDVEAALTGKREPLLFVRRGSRLEWQPPEELAPELRDGLDVTELLPKSRVQVLLHSRGKKTEFVVPTRSELVLVHAPGEPEAKRPVLVGVAEIDARHAAAGSRLPSGRWEVRAVMEVAGFNATAGVIRPAGRWVPSALGKGPARLSVIATRDGRLLKRVPLGRRIAARVPGLARILRPAVARARRRVAT